MRLQAKGNTAAVLKDWKRLARTYKKTLASGLNKTAYRVANEDMPKIMEKGIDRPTRFTKNKPAFYKRAREARLVAEVQIKDIQAEYLEAIVYGERGQKGKAIPVKIKLNKFGNISSLKAGRKINALLAKPNHFSATYSGVSGIWRKRGGKLDLLVMFSKGTYRYKRKFDWHRYTRKAADKQLPRAMAEAVNKLAKREAARTARV